MKKVVLVAALLASASLWNCVSGPENDGTPNPTQDADQDQGSVLVPLTTVSNGRTFRLENAEFLFTGPRTQTFRSSSSKEYLEVKLPVGTYTVKLQDGWQLIEVLSDGTDRAVLATLSDTAPLSLVVSATTTGTARFQIQLIDGAQMGLGRVGFDVNTGACTPTTCAAQNAQCGTISNGCGATIACGTCASGQTCNTSTNQCIATCVPQPCGNIECGTMDDGCGRIVNCGDCDPGQICDSRIRQCVDSCTHRTCSDLGATCGAIDDGCGIPLSCGTCPTGQRCNTSNKCEAICTPRTCAEAGAQCGNISDGCGGTLACGGCATGQTCNDSNQCVTTCAPRTCASANAQCGSVSDGCGGTLTCGSCAAGQTCNTSNQCEAAPSPLRVTFHTNSSWNTGYCMDVTITNAGTRPTLTWQAVIDIKGATVTSGWSSNRLMVPAGLQLSSLDYNGRLAASTGSITVGYCANNPISGYKAPTFVSSSATF